MSQRLHETRHGGDAARGTLDVSPSSKNWGVSDEVSAYKAQYSWNGSLSYKPANSPLQSFAPAIPVSNIGLINASLVNNIGGFITFTTPSGVKIPGWGALYPTNTDQWKNN